MLTPSTVKSRDVGGDLSGLDDAIYSISQGKRLTSLDPHSGPMIVTTGCSFTYGGGENDEDSWPWLLQERLGDYDVVNVAASGYGTDQALLAAERRVSHSPGVRAVLLGFADFQIERNRSSQSWLWRIYPAAKPLFLQRDSGVEEKGLVKFWSLGSTIDSVADHSVLFSRAMNLLSDRIIYRVQPYDGGKRLTVALITDFARRFQSRGIPLLVVVLPSQWKLPGAEVDGRFVIDHLRVAGIPTLVPNFPRLPDGRLAPTWFNRINHPNRQYNLVLADQVAPLVRQYVGAASEKSPAVHVNQ